MCIRDRRRGSHRHIPRGLLQRARSCIAKVSGLQRRHRRPSSRLRSRLCTGRRSASGDPLCWRSPLNPADPRSTPRRPNRLNQAGTRISTRVALHHNFGGTQIVRGPRFVTRESHKTHRRIGEQNSSNRIIIYSIKSLYLVLTLVVCIFFAKSIATKFQFWLQ